MLRLSLSEEISVPQPGAHRPVLLNEALDLLAPGAGETVVDATLGAGGHSAALLERVGPRGRVFGIDRDPSALTLAGAALDGFGSRFTPLAGDHRDLPQLLTAAGVEHVDRILFDLGISSMQVDDPERGFSFRHDGPLDMRMNPRAGRSAADLLSDITEERLREILWRFGEESHGRAIARAIIRERALHPLTRTVQLAEVVERCVRRPGPRRRIHPATRTFQALRIAVNGEIEHLESTIADAASMLRSGGRIAVIAFHSLEDRAVKHSFRSLAHRCTCPPRLPVCGCGNLDHLKILTSRPVRPSAGEIASNPRARSARLRAAERL